MSKLKDLDKWIKSGGLRISELTSQPLKYEEYTPSKRLRIYSEQITNLEKDDMANNDSVDRDDDPADKMEPPRTLKNVGLLRDLEEKLQASPKERKPDLSSLMQSLKPDKHETKSPNQVASKEGTPNFENELQSQKISQKNSRPLLSQIKIGAHTSPHCLDSLASASRLYNALKLRQKSLDSMPVPYSFQLLSLIHTAFQRHLFARTMARMMTSLPELDFEMCKVNLEQGHTQDKLSFYHRSGIGQINLQLNSKKIEYRENEVLYGFSSVPTVSQVI